jgi:plastocyanin
MVMQNSPPAIPGSSPPANENVWLAESFPDFFSRRRERAVERNVGRCGEGRRAALSWRPQQPRALSDAPGKEIDSMTIQDCSSYTRFPGRAAVMGGILLSLLLVADCALASQPMVTDPPNNSPRLAAAPPSSVPTPQAPLNVSIASFAFAPETIAASPGQTIIWTNNDRVPHTVTNVDKLWDSRPIAPGQSFSVTLDRAGTYAYYCAIHPHMTAKIIVR